MYFLTVLVNYNNPDIKKSLNKLDFKYYSFIFFVINLFLIIIVLTYFDTFYLDCLLY